VSARFDQFEVDLVSGELRGAGGPRARLQQLPLQVLRLLMEAEGRVVSRDQLRSALWSENTFVDFDHSVNTAIKKLRQALGDSVGNPRLVETVPKVGYRFLVPVKWVTDAKEGSSPKPPSEDASGVQAQPAKLPSPGQSARRQTATAQ
jgi:DNA-binding winged helix-turn-helix (wHTH) protein